MNKIKGARKNKLIGLRACIAVMLVVLFILIIDVGVNINIAGDIDKCQDGEIYSIFTNCFGVHLWGNTINKIKSKDITIEFLYSDIKVSITSSCVSNYMNYYTSCDTTSNAIIVKRVFGEDNDVLSVTISNVEAKLKMPEKRVSLIDENGTYSILPVEDDQTTFSLSNSKTYIVEYIETADIKLEENNVSVKMGSTKQIQATIVPLESTDQEIEYSVANPELATVDSTGIVTRSKSWKYSRYIAIW